MIFRVKEAIRDALLEIQRLGFVVLPALDGEHIEIYWPGERAAPEIEPLLAILQSDSVALQAILTERTVTVPMSFILGYPWEHPIRHWKNVYRSLSTARSKSARVRGNTRRRASRFTKIEWMASGNRYRGRSPGPLVAERPGIFFPGGKLSCGI